jgi:hypothetical protein
MDFGVQYPITVGRRVEIQIPHKISNLQCRGTAIFKSGILLSPSLIQLRVEVVFNSGNKDRMVIRKKVARVCNLGNKTLGREDRRGGPKRS